MVAVRQARDPTLYTAGGVADTLDGRFDLIVLHVVPLMRRLRQCDEAGRQLSQALFDVMFDDMDQSLREMGVGDLRVGKRVKQMARAFYGRAKAYDQAFDQAPGADRRRSIAEALERNVFNNAPPPADRVQAMAGYVEILLDALDRHSPAACSAASSGCRRAPACGCPCCRERPMSADVRTGAGRRRLIAPGRRGPAGPHPRDRARCCGKEALKHRLDLLALERLAAKLRVEPADDAERAIRVSGTIQGRLAQSCVVTLEPVPRTLCESISILYAPLPEDSSEREVEVLAEGDEAEPLPRAASMRARSWQSISLSSSTPIRATRTRRTSRSLIRQATGSPERARQATIWPLDRSRRLAN